MPEPYKASPITIRKVAGQRKTGLESIDIKSIVEQSKQLKSYERPYVWPHAPVPTELERRRIAQWYEEKCAEIHQVSLLLKNAREFLDKIKGSQFDNEQILNAIGELKDESSTLGNNKFLSSMLLPTKFKERGANNLSTEQLIAKLETIFLKKQNQIENSLNYLKELYA